MQSDEHAARLADEHAIITEIGDQLRILVSSTPRKDPAQWVAELCRQFDNYVAHLRQHLGREEDDGYLAQVMESWPTLSGAVDIIRYEHEELTRLIQDVQNTVHELTPQDNLLRRDCCERVKQLMYWIERHEEHENYIVTFAFTQDLGTNG